MDNLIRVERARKRISQQELADALSVSRQTIMYMEANRYIPSTLLSFRIAKYFGKLPHELFMLEDHEMSFKEPNPEK